MAEAAVLVRKLTARDIPLLQAELAAWLPAHLDAAAAHHHRVLVQPLPDGDELLGIAEYQQVLDEGHLLGIAIVPAQQRRGLGMHLLQAVLGEMRAGGCTRCLLEVRRSNVAAQALYLRAQFTLDGVRKDYYPPLAAGQREDALLYSRSL